MERQRREQAEKDRERRQHEEKKRLLERLQRERQEKEKRQAGKYHVVMIYNWMGPLTRGNYSIISLGVKSCSV